MNVPLSDFRVPPALLAWGVSMMLAGFGVYLALDSRVGKAEQQNAYQDQRLAKLETQEATNAASDIAAAQWRGAVDSKLDAIIKAQGKAE